MTLRTCITTAYVIPTSSCRAKHHHQLLSNPQFYISVSRATKESQQNRRRRRLFFSQTNPEVLPNDIDTLSQDQAASSLSSSAVDPTDQSNKSNPKNVGWIHGVTSKAGPLNEAVLNILHQHPQYQSYTYEDTNALITLGAVWAQMETLSRDEVLSLYDLPDNTEYNDARYMYADLPKGWNSGIENNDDYSDSGGGTNNNNGSTNEEDDLDAYIQTMSQQRYRRILTPSSIPAGMDIRVYPEPKRFTNTCESIQSKHLLYEDTTFIVVDKPPMLPTQPDASNYVECCPACVQTQLGPFTDILGNTIERPLLCHRIDTCVGGVVVLSKDQNGQSVFHQYQRERQLRKMYLAVTTKAVPIGTHIHWMWAPQSARTRRGGSSSSNGPPCQLVRHTPPDSRRIARAYWNRCVLEVVQCVPIQIDLAKLSPSSVVDNEETSVPQQYYQSTIRLVTGRKHQVRAQLSSLGCPILYDTLYGPIAGYTLDDLEHSEDDMERQIASCRIPTQPIGLQAAGILFGGIKVRANPPWWAS